MSGWVNPVQRQEEGLPIQEVYYVCPSCSGNRGSGCTAADRIGWWMKHCRWVLLLLVKQNLLANSLCSFKKAWSSDVLTLFFFLTGQSLIFNVMTNDSNEMRLGKKKRYRRKLFSYLVCVSLSPHFTYAWVRIYF